MRTKSEERRQAMVATAAELFLQRGYEATSMAEICSRVGLQGHFVRLFQVQGRVVPERDENAGRRTHVTRLARLVPGGDIAAALQAFGENYLQVILGPDLMAMRGIIAGELVRGAAQQFYEAGPRQGWNKVAAYLEAEMQAGRLRQADGWIAAMHLLSLMQAEYQQTFLVGVVSEEDLAQLGERVARGVEVFMAWYAL
jgi:AcrR family transcriptional regulator